MAILYNPLCRWFGGLVMEDASVWTSLVAKGGSLNDSGEAIKDTENFSILAFTQGFRQVRDQRSKKGESVMLKRDKGKENNTKATTQHNVHCIEQSPTQQERPGDCTEKRPRSRPSFLATG